MKWDITTEEMRKVTAIVDRAEKRINQNKRALVMDIVATHANGCPLDLNKLLNAKAFDFFHDIYGIIKHIDRHTGELQDCFLPRCARPSE